MKWVNKQPKPAFTHLSCGCYPAQVSLPEGDQQVRVRDTLVQCPSHAAGASYGSAVPYKLFQERFMSDRPGQVTFIDVDRRELYRAPQPEKNPRSMMDFGVVFIVR
jgi:hypothetical protein